MSAEEVPHAEPEPEPEHGRGAAADAAPLPPLSYADYREFRRLLRMLDIQQHLNLSAHLYSAFLIGRLTRGRMPHRSWTAWPLEDPPLPPQILDDFPLTAPRVVTPRDVAAVRARAHETYPVPPDPPTDAPAVLLRACEEVLRRIVHRRIRAETTPGIEAVLEPEPELGGALSQAIVSTVDRYITRAPGVARRHRLVSWQHLGIRGPARRRLRRLFSRDLREYTGEVGAPLAGNPAGDTTESDGEGSPASSPASSPTSTPASTSARTSDTLSGDANGDANGAPASGGSPASGHLDNDLPTRDADSDSGSESDVSRTGFTGSDSPSPSEDVLEDSAVSDMASDASEL